MWTRFGTSKNYIEQGFAGAIAIDEVVALELNLPIRHLISDVIVLDTQYEFVVDVKYENIE